MLDIKKVPFLRWSFWRLMLGIKHLEKHWQVGDGREDAAVRYVLENAKKGDPADVIRVIDEYAYKHSFLINVGDEKGKILDEALRQASPKQVLELGAYIGYSAVRMAMVAPGAQITSIEIMPKNAANARRVIEHAGLAARITIVEGALGEGKKQFPAGSLDFVFVDHDKAVYLSDLKLILEKGWLHKGSIVVADNVKFPGAPEYRAFMKENEGKIFKTIEHETHVEYQSVIKDLVLVSEKL